MTARLGLVAVAIAVAASASAALAGPLPTVPSFELPDAPLKGVVDARTLQVRGQTMLGTRIKVAGYVTWIYDCVDQLLAAKRYGKTRDAVLARIAEDQTVCERKRLYLSATAKPPPSEPPIWVVEVPRPPFPHETARLPKQTLASWPKVPAVKVGDYVIITGNWETTAPHGDRNSQGLLIYDQLEPATPQPVKLVALADVKLPTLPPLPAPRAIAPLDDGHRRTWAARLAECSTRDPDSDTAIARCQETLTANPHHAPISYRLAKALARRRDFTAAHALVTDAIEVDPKNASYHGLLGQLAMAVAERAWRDGEARRLNKASDEIALNRSRIKYDTAVISLARAVSLDPSDHTSHYLIGVIHQSRGEDRAAAERFTRALELEAGEREYYASLIGLYRRWNYTTEALAIAQRGADKIANQRAPMLFLLGEIYSDQGNDPAAIEAFSRALNAQPDYHLARYGRGQVYFRRKDYAKARPDLALFVNAAGDDLEFFRATAQRMLGEIARTSE